MNNPHKGWIYAVRKALGMSARQVGVRMGIRQQSVKRLELNEVDESITVRSMKKAAAAMDCKFVYQFIKKD
ncbi:MAG: helix-turn-helix domain-containing protein [Bacteroidota bacterium]